MYYIIGILCTIYNKAGVFLIIIKEYLACKDHIVLVFPLQTVQEIPHQNKTALRQSFL